MQQHGEAKTEIRMDTPGGGWVWVTIAPPSVNFRLGPHTPRGAALTTLLRDSVRSLDLPPRYWVVVQEYPSMNFLRRTTVEKLLSRSS